MTGVRVPSRLRYLLLVVALAQSGSGFSSSLCRTLAPFRQQRNTPMASRKTRASIDNEAASSSEPIRKKKKNKYAKFSKVENFKQDPLEALIEESKQKMEKLNEDRPNRKSIYVGTEPGPAKRLEFPDNRIIDPYDPSTFGYVEIGTILGPHGVHGWSKVKGCTDYPERLTRAGMLLHMKAPRKRAPRKITLASGKQIQKDTFLIQVQGIYNRTAAENMRGNILYYATQQDTVASEDELLVSRLVGLRVLTETEEYVGIVQGVVLAEELCAIPGLGHDMLEVEVEQAAADLLPMESHLQKKLVLIPNVPDIVPKIDLSNKVLIITPPPGLLDLTYRREEKVRIKALLPPAKG